MLPQKMKAAVVHELGIVNAAKNDPASIIHSQL
jgi:hypothetical protein